MFVYKVLWIFTVKCLQLFNKELYVYFVQAPFCESLRKQILNYGLHAKLKFLQVPEWDSACSKQSGHSGPQA